MKLYDFSIEYVKNPTLIPVEGLRFGWKLDSDRTNVLQTHYRIRISNQAGVVVDTQKVADTAVCDITIPGLKLESCTDYKVEVTVWDNHGDKANLTHMVSTELKEEDWADAQWIKPADYLVGWAPYLRTKFQTAGVKKAVLYASGLGVAEYYINGKRTDDFFFDPPSANYEKTVYYRRFDVTELIKEGGNALTVHLGEGWYSQGLVWGKDFALFPEWTQVRDSVGASYGEVCAKIKLMLTLDDGSIQVITTNTKDWTYKYGPVTRNNLWAGEIYDSRLEVPGFAEYEGNENGWGKVIEDDVPKGALTACLMPPIRVIRSLPAIDHHGSTGVGDGTYIYDIGENIGGIAEFRIPPSPPGHIYVFRYAEVLNEAGSLDHRSSGAYATMCIQQDIYICNGNAEGEIYRPKFGYRGFRYVEVSGIYDLSMGYGTVPQLSIVTGLQVATDLERVTEFSTSFESLDKLYQIMHNTYLSNYHGHPEDCPLREKSGWLGDAQIVANWGLLNYDITASYEKYLNDIRTTKEVYGQWNMASPGKRGCGLASPLWSCAQVLFPYYLYKYSGDREAVTGNIDLMREWVEYEKGSAEDYILYGGLGDWSPVAGDGKKMPIPHSSTMIFYEVCMKMAELSEIFCYGDEKYYSSLAEKIKESLNRHFYDYNSHSYGHVSSDGVALFIGCFPDGEKEKLTASLTARIIAEDYEMCTGIYGNKYLVPVLLESGYGDIAMKFLFNEKHTSFETMMRDGATSIWEVLSLQSIFRDKTIIIGSYDHPMHGGFLYACIEYLAGIRPIEPGFAKFAFKPCFMDLAKEVKVSLGSVYGKIKAEISEDCGIRKCKLTVPAGTICVIDADGELKLDGCSCTKGYCVGSGVYEITIK